MVVTFCGHRDVPVSTELTERLCSVLTFLIKGGADQFLLGGYGNFDLLSARIVLDLKSEYPNIRSTIVLPYLNQKYDQSLYDDSIYPPLERVPLRYAISHRNRWMVDYSAIVVSYVTRDWGGAAKTIEYAKKKNKSIISVAK